jgi:hypothetical protein
MFLEGKWLKRTEQAVFYPASTVWTCGSWTYLVDASPTPWNCTFRMIYLKT